MRSDELSAYYAQAILREQIRKLLIEQDLKQKDLANILGIKPAAMSQRMTGGQWLTDSEVAATAVFLGVEVDYLMGGSYYRHQAHRAWLDAEAAKVQAAKEERLRRKRSVRALCCECGGLQLIDSTKCGPLDAGLLKAIGSPSSLRRWVGRAGCPVCEVETDHAVLMDAMANPDELESNTSKPTVQQIAARERDALVARLTGFNIDVRYRRFASRKSRLKNGVPIIHAGFDASKSQWRIEIQTDVPASIQLDSLSSIWEVISTDDKDWWSSSDLTPETGVWMFAPEEQWNAVAADLVDEITTRIGAERQLMAMDLSDAIRPRDREVS